MRQVNVNQQRLRANLAQMINIYSPSGKERQLLDYLSDYLCRHNFTIERQMVDEQRYNIIIHADQRYQSNGILFIGHLDTIPAYSLDDYRYQENEGGSISGLGAVDMKSGCAAMIEAFLSFKELFSDSLPASLALVVGEEDSGDGVMRLLQSYQYTWAVVAEPTNLKTCLNHYGYLECELRTYGRRRHASYSGETHNAVYSMLNLLLDLRGYFKENNNYIYNIRELHSSDAGFSVPDKCICWLDVHLPANLDLGVLKKEIIFVAQKFKRKNLKARVRLAFPTVHKGYRVSSRAAIVKTIKQAYMQTGVRWHTDKFRSDSDASILNESGVKAVILGPGRLARAHSKKELISAGKIETAANIYLNILQEVNGVG